MGKEKKPINKCDECELKSKELEPFANREWCPDCLIGKTGICEKCNERFYEEGLITFDNKVWCEDCLNDETVICEDCDDRVYRDHVNYVSDDPICDGCFDGGNYFQCDDCGSAYHDDDYGSDGYCQNCLEDNKPTAEPDNRRYYTKSRRDLAVGIEIEAEKGNYHNVYQSLAHKGFGVCSDGSLGRHGIEIQVPASNGGTTENLVHQACQSLDDSGFEISKQCGLHVHIEYPSQWKTIKNLLLMIYACEPVFYAINPQSRQNNNFCQPLYKSFSVHEIVKAKAMEIDKLFYSKKHPDLTKRKIADFKKSKWNDCRYFGFNLHSLFYQKTVEFRYHSGTMEENKILRWIKLLKSILLYVRFNYDQQKVLRLTEQPSVLGKIKYLKTMLKLDELLSSCLVSRYIKFQK